MSDKVSFNRAITTPKRGIGPKTIEAIEKFTGEQHIMIMDTLSRADELFSGSGILKKVEDFYDIMKSLGEMRGKTGLDALAQKIVEKSGYEMYLQMDDPLKFEDRIDNVKELITAMGEYENLSDEDDLTAFLSEVSLVTDVDTWDDSSDALTLMTLHSAKGLEFPSVYIVGVEKGLFPLPVSFDEPAGLEEERRLFYVGMTRAEERLHVSYALQRMRYGSYSGGASMFVSELPLDILDIETPELLYTKIPLRNQPIRRAMEFEDYSQEMTDYDEELRYSVGSYIRHPVFGRGRITACSGSGENTKLTVMFGAQEKKIIVKYAKLIQG